MSGYNGFGAGFDGGGNMQNMNQSANGDNVMILGSSSMNAPNMVGGQSLDDIVSHNEKVIRRQSMPQQQYGSNQGQVDADMRRMTMMDFSSGSSGGPLDNFQFDPNTSMGQDDLGAMSSTMGQSNRQPVRKRASAANLTIDPQFDGGNSSYGGMAYQSPAHPNNNLDMDMTSPYLSAEMGMTMDFGNGTNMENMMDQQDQQMNMYSQQSPFQSSMMNTPTQTTNINNSVQNQAQNSGGGRFQYGPTLQRQDSESTQRQALSRAQSMNMQDMTPQPSLQRTPSAQFTSQQSKSTDFSPRSQHAQSGSVQERPLNPDRSMSNMSITQPYSGSRVPSFDQQPSAESAASAALVRRPSTQQNAYKNAYSSSGFDMLGVLMRVATRPNPEINLGSVDLSCAFVVCDAEKDDSPIIYCSDNFERLTGYTRHMILGRNCRFLQSPDGHVEPGIRRKYVDDDSVLYLKNMVSMRKEAQISLINYRRGGQPFMNLLTTIPICWDTDQVKFFVGFQVDLVEQPNAVTSRNPDGSYAVNYQRNLTMPRYVMNAPESTHKAELGQTVPRDDVSAILSTIGTGESEYAKRMWDKVLLENTDDVVHVLSLKGLFQWVSPSALKVLEYEPGEIIGTALSSVCHPSDIVPVTRELKDTSTGALVNVVFRIRRKNSGYMWFEGHGSLHTEQGKGRKSIIMIGRERPVYTLSKQDILSNGGIGENELWTKLSTSGMFLFVSSNVRQLLDRHPDELVGGSIQSLMRPDSKQDFARILEHARTGKKASVKHEVINRRGQVLQAFTSLYPGDATEGQKPTFIVAQTRLIKYPRNNIKPTSQLKTDRNADSVYSGNATPASYPSRMQQSSSAAGTSISQSASPMPNYVSTETTAPTYAGENGLVLGRQDASLASEDNLFDELKTTKSSSWQYEIRQLEKKNRMLAEEVQGLLAAKKKRKRRKGAGQLQKDCANCHTRVTPEWRRGPSGQRDLCNSCGLRWAKLNGRVSPRTSSQQSVHSTASDKAAKASPSPRNSIVKTEAGTQANQQNSTSSTGAQRSSGHHSGNHASSQEAHSTQMEGAGGVPERIDEGVEPD